MSSTVDVAVVGAGVTGSATALRLAERGREVVLLERFPLDHDHGSSHGPTRIFRCVYDDPFYVELALRALPGWRALELAAAEPLLEQTGGLDIGPAGVLDPVRRAMEAGGAAVERVADPAGRFPGVRTPHAGLFSPQTGVIAAARALAAMRRLALEHGAEIRDRCRAEVHEISDDGVVLGLNGKRVTARRCVLAAGPWTVPLLSGHLAADPPLRITREQIVYLPQRAPFPVLIDRSDEPRLHYALPQAFGAAGARAGHHLTGAVVAPDAPRADDEDAVRRIVGHAEATLPAVVPDPVGTETCLYTTAPDEDFVFDRIGALVVASPCSGHGFKFAPVTGEIAARLALDEDPLVPLDRFRLLR